ncbi:hypothetical protein D3C77_20080 [compost metagenome]|jgi:hypothetical protein|uniref:hypothetical protein n=1 Tax=Pseudomonas TaxID=286 RepID=UPI000CFD3F96|nr:hypothetical protein [Pseudomonas sp. MYb187]PRA63132.1 hypothetical protein CQ065_14745 [Pseudomonas sp. MYb187]
MSTPASSTSGRTGIGKHLIRAAVGAGRVLNRFESNALNSGVLASVPFKYRKIGFYVFKLILMLAVASVAISLALGMLAVWTIAALPISTERQPRIHEMSHPRHHLRFPEMYDDNGASR